ncbi:MAG: hypothetical protein GNW80_01680 [Asgard group archaeon]|nr:hypothetical protein [Asgard group archaeon]
MRESCQELLKKATKLHKRSSRKEPFDAINAYISSGECFSENEEYRLGHENYLEALKLLVFSKNLNELLNLNSVEEILKVTHLILPIFDYNLNMISVELIDKLIETLDLLFSGNSESLSNSFLIMETQYQISEKAYDNGLIEKEQFTDILNRTSRIAEKLYQNGGKLLDKTKFGKAKISLSMAVILLQLISDPKMDLAFEISAKANLLAGKYEITQRKHIKGLESLLEAIKIYNTLDMHTNAKNALAIFKKSFKLALEEVEGENGSDGSKLKKLLLLEEEYKTHNEIIKQYSSKKEIVETAIKTPYVRLPYPREYQQFDENSNKNILLRERYALEQSLQSIQTAFRDGLIGSEDYARLLLGINRNIYKVKRLLEDKE